MSNNQTNFYHKHIQSNILRLDERKDKFIHHRLDFLKDFCEPIQQKIDQIQKQIEKYKTMRDTQTQVIQNQPKIKQIKVQIDNYRRTHQYYLHKINQLSKQCLQIQQHNHKLSQQIILFNYSIKAHPQQLGFHLPSLSKPRQTIPKKRLITSNTLTQDISQQEEQPKTTHNINFVRISQKIQRMKIKDKSGQDKVKEYQPNGIGELQHQECGQQQQWKQRLRSLKQKLNRFNKTESLFTECFETKKGSIQKSVSQLQSKLITNREQFLRICQAIGSKENKITFEQFKILSCDEIVTLFISFVWLNRKLSGRMRAKRGVLIEAIKKIRGLW